MQFSLYVSAAPPPQVASSALLFARAVLQQDHSLYRVFFYDRAVLSAKTRPESAGWLALLDHCSVDLCLCSASFARNGLSEPQHLNQPYCPPFSIGGLVQLVDAQAQSDRLISFL